MPEAASAYSLPMERPQPSQAPAAASDPAAEHVLPMEPRQPSQAPSEAASHAAAAGHPSSLLPMERLQPGRAAASHAAGGLSSSLPLPLSLHAMSDESLRAAMAIKLGEFAPLVEDLKQNLSSLVTTCAAIGTLAISCKELLEEHDDRDFRRRRLD